MGGNIDQIGDLWRKDPEWQNFVNPVRADIDLHQSVQRAVHAVVSPVNKWGAAHIDIGSGFSSKDYFPGNSLGRLTAMDATAAFLSGNAAKNTILHDVRDVPLPVPGKKYNVSVSLFLFRYLTPQEQLNLIQEIYRITKPGGNMLVIDHNRLDHNLEVSRFDPYMVEEHFKRLGAKEVNRSTIWMDDRSHRIEPRFVSKVLATKA